MKHWFLRRGCYVSATETVTDKNIQQWCWAQTFHGLHLGTDRPLIWPNLTRIVMKSSAIMWIIITPFLDRLHLFKRTVVESILIYILCWRIKKMFKDLHRLYLNNTEDNRKEMYYNGNNTDKNVPRSASAVLTF